MTIALWVIQALLALAFLAAGFPKAFQPIATLSKTLPWTASVPASLVRFIGAVEILGALGLILPGVTHIAPGLTVAAAIGLAVTMLLAAGFHARRGEYQRIAPSIVLFALALVIVIGRIALAPLA